MCVREWKKPLDQRYMLRARARWAQPEDVHDVMRLGKAMLCGHILSPLFHRIRLDFDGCSALATNEVVVVRVGRAGPKKAFAVLLKRVSITGPGKVSERTVDSGQADRATGIAERTVQRLSAHKTL